MVVGVLISYARYPRLRSLTSSITVIVPTLPADYEAEIRGVS